MTNDSANFEIVEEYDLYQVLAVNIHDKSHAFRKIFKLPKHLQDWVIELAFYGIVYRDGKLNANDHILHRAKWDFSENKWVNVELTDT